MDYNRQRATTNRLLTKFGKPVLLTRIDDGGVYDPVSGETSGGADLSLSGVGVLLNYRNDELNNSDIKFTDRKLLFSGDTLKIDDQYGPWRVYSLNLLDPDESGTILTTAQMRK